MADEGKKVKRINTKKKFVADGVFQAELHEFLARCLGRDGYAGLEVRATSMSTEIRVKATKTKEILELKARKIRELKSLIEKRYGFNDEDKKVELTVKPFAVDHSRNLCAAAQCETIKYKLLSGTPVRMAANNILAAVMRRGMAKGCEIIISGKVRGQRAKAMKYKQGYLVSTGQPKKEFVDQAYRHVELRQGVLGVRVKIMGDVEKLVGKTKIVMPDYVKIQEPKREEEYSQPTVIANKRAEQQQQ